MVYVSCWASKELLTPWHAATALFIRTQMHARPGKLLIRNPIGGHWLWQSFFFYSILFFYMRIISWCPQLARPLATQGWSCNSAHSNQNDHSIRLESAHNPIGVRLILNAFNRYQPVSIGHFEFSLLVFVVVFFFYCQNVLDLFLMLRRVASGSWSNGCVRSSKFYAGSEDWFLFFIFIILYLSSSVKWRCDIRIRR